MLTTDLIESILTRLPRLYVGVLGDLFLDRYLDLDTNLTEPSLETGLDAYQVVRVRSYPGAAGTVINNLSALGVGRIVPISMIGDDGEGYELRQALSRLPGVDGRYVFSTAELRTPTYTKPMLQTPGQTECVRAILGLSGDPRQAQDCAVQLARRASRPVFCTCGERGLFLVDPRQSNSPGYLIPSYTVAGPIDPVGAGDSTSAGIAC